LRVAAVDRPVQCGRPPDINYNGCKLAVWANPPGANAARELEIAADDATNPILLPKLSDMDVCSFLNLNCHSMIFFAGQVSHQFATSHADRLLLDLAYTYTNSPRLGDITEFGTAGGLTSMYFGLACRLRGAVLHTYDYMDKRTGPVKRAWLNDSMVYIIDNLLIPTLSQSAIASLLRPNQLAFMDNGNKAWEVEHYAQYLTVGSVLATHDWRNEVDGRIEPALTRLGFVRRFNDFALTIGSHVRVWKRLALAV
jgi:predicted O-methyltransferase YrrM